MVWIWLKLGFSNVIDFFFLPLRAGEYVFVKFIAALFSNTDIFYGSVLLLEGFVNLWASEKVVEVIVVIIVWEEADDFTWIMTKITTVMLAKIYHDVNALL